MSKKNQAARLGVVAVAALAGQTWAFEPAGVKAADILITPTVKLSERWDSNFRAVEVGAENTFVTTLAPAVNFNKKGNKGELNVDLGATSDTFHSSLVDNNVDYSATAGLSLQLDSRNRLKLDAGFVHTEETASLVQNLQNDINEKTNVGLLYGFGAETARGQFELGARASQLRFQNDLVVAGKRLNSEREYDDLGFTATLYAALAPKTKALLEARHTTYEYVSNTGLDSTNTAVLVGVKWDATAKTSGAIRVGNETKEFDAAALGDRDNAMWEANITWNPLSYSTFVLSTGSKLDEGNNGAALIETRSNSLDWTHQWLERLSSKASLSLMNQDYLGAGGGNRSDEITNAGVGLTYSMRRWLDVGVGYKYSQNDSNAATYSFDRDMISLSLTAGL